jgi:hypothetical protein
MTLQVGAPLASGLKTALLDDTRGRLAQAAIGAFDCRTSVGGQRGTQGALAEDNFFATTSVAPGGMSFVPHSSPVDPKAKLS